MIKEILDNGHHYLQMYCVLEVIMMLALWYGFYEQLGFIRNHYMTMTEWQMASFASFPAATWLMMKDVWASVNVQFHKS